MSARGDAEVPRIAAAAALLLRARSVVHALALGARRGARRGTGVEFFEFVPYTPGVDLRRIDPLASARTDRLLVRTYREDSRRTVHVLLDRSSSMGIAARGPHPARWEAARTLALALVLAAARGGDRCRLWTFAAAGADRGPSPGGRAAVARAAVHLAALAPAPPGGATALGGALRDVAARCLRGDAVVLISDLLSAGAVPREVFRALHARRHPVVVLHLLGAEDRELPHGPVRLIPLEREAPVELDGDAARAAYARALDGFVRGWREALTALGARVVRVDADRPLAPALAAALGRRG